MKKKVILSVCFAISLLPMLLNQYGGAKGVQEITGLINLLNPIGIFTVFIFSFSESDAQERSYGFPMPVI